MKKYCYFFLMFCVFFPSRAQELEKGLGAESVEKSVLIQQYPDTTDLSIYTETFDPRVQKNLAIIKEAFASTNPSVIHKGYRLLGYDYMAIEDSVLAKESFEKSQHFAQLSKNDTAIARSYSDLANFYTVMKRQYAKANQLHNLSIDLYSKLKDTAGLSDAYFNKIVTAIRAEDFRTVYTDIIKARKLNGFEENTAASVALDYFLGAYYAQKGDYKTADIYFLKAIEVAERRNLMNDLEQAYSYYYKSLQKQERYKDAFEALLMFQTYNEKNKANELSIERAALSTRFQVSEYKKDVKAAELESALQQERVSKNEILNIFLIILSTCFLLLMITLFIAYKKRRVLVQELKIKNAEYLEAKEETERLSRSKTKFFSTISHELRTPLYGVIGLSTILLEDPSLKTHKEDLKSLKFSADYLLALINDVLQLNKIDDSTLGSESGTFNIRELIKKIAASFEYMRIQNNNEIHIHISDAVPNQLFGNSVQLSQILMNLIGNACKFTENGHVYIIAETTANSISKSTVKFYVRDSGIGIPKEKQETIFEEFSQLGSGGYKYQGTGLGLPIVKKLLKLSGSDIHLSSEEGKGSLFSFSLDFEVVAEESKKETIISLVDDEVLKNKKILIVEDNRINQTVTKKILEKHKIECTIAENGAIAVDNATDHEYDLILMDINMPVMNGIEATKEIRTFNSNVPILALTAVEIEEMRQQIFDSGMDGIIVKPYDVKTFIHTLVQHLSETKEASKKEAPSVHVS